ncbi:MAG: HAD-IIB family hydrolase [Patescibacteria group bacterium]
MNKIVAFDLDGTLAESKQAITHEVATILYSLSLKTKVIIISGGSYEQFTKQFVPGIVNAAKVKGNTRGLENVILMPTNGSKRYEYDVDMHMWKETQMYPFNEEIKKKVMLELNSIIAGNFDVPRNHYGEYIEDRVTQITFSALGQTAPLEEKSIWDPTRSKRLKIKEVLEKAIPEIQAHVGGMTSIDILPKNFNKATGLLRYLSEEKLSIHDMLFIGDAIFEGGNDYSPLQAGIETKKTSGPKETVEIMQTLL